MTTNKNAYLLARLAPRDEIVSVQIDVFSDVSPTALGHGAWAVIRARQGEDYEGAVKELLDEIAQTHPWIMKRLPSHTRDLYKRLCEQSA